jgi:hypothetical protein
LPARPSYSDRRNGGNGVKIYKKRNGLKIKLKEDKGKGVFCSISLANLGKFV